MSELIALDVAILPPAHVSRLAIDLSASLPPADADRLTLDAEHLPHVTLMQLFVRQNELETAYERIDDVLRGTPPLALRVTGAGEHDRTIWLAIDRSPELATLHEQLLDTLRGLERHSGGPSAFFGGDARVADVVWVTGYRLKSSLEQFTPHITLGHGKEPPSVEPFTFEAATVGACHLGRFCTCRHLLRQWTLGPVGR